MKIKKQAISLLCILVITLSSLVGCSTDNTNDTTHRPEGNAPSSNNVTDIMNDGAHSTEVDNTEDNREDNREVDLNNPDGILDSSNNNTEDSIDTSELLSKICEFRVIDCGQADSILIHSKTFNVLVDAGLEKDATAIKKVLDNLGVKKLDILIATHPHSDHIGGMKSILENYETDKIIMSPSGHTSQTYEELLLTIESQGKTITKAEPNAEYTLGDLKLKVVAPCSDYEDLNEDSVVVLASYGDTDVLLTGDAGFKSEKDYVSYLKDIEILKVGHHGSETATSDNLLDTTTPEVAVISCGVDNQYGHPDEEVISKLEKRDIEIYRTDVSGDIIIRSDGTDYSIETSKGNKSSTSTNNQSNTEVKENKPENNNQENMVYVSQSGKKYHSTDQCSRLFTSKEIYEVTEQEAINSGSTKCSKCW